MKKTCIKCGAPRGKGTQYVTIKVPTTTTKFGLNLCPKCGSELSEKICQTIIEWRRSE